MGSTWPCLVSHLPRVSLVNMRWSFHWVSRSAYYYYNVFKRWASGSYKSYTRHTWYVLLFQPFIDTLTGSRQVYIRDRLTLMEPDFNFILDLERTKQIEFRKGSEIRYTCSSLWGSSIRLKLVEIPLREFDSSWMKATESWMSLDGAFWLKHRHEQSKKPKAIWRRSTTIRRRYLINKPGKH